MAKAKAPIPKSQPIIISKQDVLQILQQIDQDRDSTNRVLAMENGFREKIKALSKNLPLEASKLTNLWTNPFVLLAYSSYKGYTQVQQIEKDILVGKVFSFMETSVGRMVESVVLPIYSWKVVESEMHSSYSVIDGELVRKNQAAFVTLKSGPRCINADMVAGMSSAIVENYRDWASDKGVAKIDFTIGIIYGTYKKSQKKDWHILAEARRLLSRP